MGCCYSLYEDKSLLECKLSTTPKITLEGIKTKVVVLDCYDGDTCDVILKFQKRMVQVRCRLYGIDTPEMKGPESDKAVKARNKLIELVCGGSPLPNHICKRQDIQSWMEKEKQVCLAEFGKWDKYGRCLVTLYYNAININKKLIDMGLAKPYDGGTKTK